MKFCDGLQIEKALYFSKRASLLALSQVIDYITVKERFSASRRREYIVDVIFHPVEEYVKEYNVKRTEILAIFATELPVALKKRNSVRDETRN